jgi:hypothetical protein
VALKVEDMLQNVTQGLGLWQVFVNTDINLQVKTKNWLTTWSWALLEKLPIVYLFKNLPAIYRTRRFITVFTRTLHLSYPEPDWSSPYHTILSLLSSLLILSTHVRLGLRSGLSLATNILNKQSRTADKEWSFSLGVRRGANNSSPQKKKK